MSASAPEQIERRNAAFLRLLSSDEVLECHQLKSHLLRYFESGELLRLATTPYAKGRKLKVDAVVRSLFLAFTAGVEFQLSIEPKPVAPPTKEESTALVISVPVVPVLPEPSRAYRPETTGKSAADEFVAMRDGVVVKVWACTADEVICQTPAGKQVRITLRRLDYIRRDEKAVYWREKPVDTIM